MEDPRRSACGSARPVPFTLPYQITLDEIVVLALAHTSRRPGYWSRRR
jgi:hypothetical protein